MPYDMLPALSVVLDAILWALGVWAVVVVIVGVIALLWNEFRQ